MTPDHELFISDEDDELRRIKQKKLAEMMERKQNMSTGPIHVRDSDFGDIVNRHSIALVDFWAPWCGPCLALAPTIDELSKEYSGKVFVCKLNVDENPKTTESFEVFSIPTLILMKDGQEVERIVGCVPKKHIEAALKKHLG